MDLWTSSFCNIKISSIVLLGVRGFYNPYSYTATGGHVSLPCSDMYILDCSSFVWTYSSPQEKKPFDVMTYGKVRTDNTERAERMSPGPWLSAAHC